MYAGQEAERSPSCKMRGLIATDSMCVSQNVARAMPANHLKPQINADDQQISKKRFVTIQPRAIKITLNHFSPKGAPVFSRGRKPTELD